MLVLFDIDGTLLLTQHVGTRSMHDAARELLGEGFSFVGVEVAGRIDPAIWADVARANGISDPEAHHDRFRAAYARHLRRRLAEMNTVTLLPGVTDLLESLRRLEGLTLGLLTGNYPETGRLKIEAAGLAPSIFEVSAWGSDGRTRRDLAVVALDRQRRRALRPLQPGEVVIVGDTPHDVDCARAAACRALAVATGSYGRAALESAGADLVVDDLTDTSEIVRWILRA